MTNLSLVSGDEDEIGEHLFNAPLPQYERTWIHPSEHAQHAEDLQPKALDRPTTRTLTLFAVVTCAAATVGMLIVALPGRVPTPPTPHMSLGGSSDPTVPGLDLVSAPVAATVTESGVLISVIDGAAVGQKVHVATPERTEFDAIVVGVEPELGVSLLKVVADQAIGARLAVTHVADQSVVPGSPVWVATTAFGVELSHISSYTQGLDETRIPLEPFAVSHHGGTVFTDGGDLLGWCVERDGRHWLLPANVARSAVLRLNNDVIQP